MKLLADVNVSRRVVERLRALGVDVHHVPDLLDPRTADIDILALARREGAVLVSFDQDFGALLAASGERQPSFLNLRLSAVTVEGLAFRLHAVLSAFADDLAEGVIVTLDDEGLRVRRLPVG